MPNVPARITPVDPGILNGPLATVPRVTPLDLYPAFILAVANPNTRSARVEDMKLFGRWLQVEPAQACALFVAGGRGRANALALAWRAAELARGMAPATVNRRLSALRELVRMGRLLELIDWQCDIDSIPSPTPVRDCTGPTESEWDRVWSVLITAEDTPKNRRDRSLVRLIHDSALRVSESLGIDMEHVDLAGARVRIRGKGGARVWVTISPLAIRYLREWLEMRGADDGPVFTTHVRDRSRDAEFLARCDELRSAGLNWPAVAHALNAEGCPTPGGQPWNGQNARSHYLAAANPRGGTRRLGAREFNRILIALSEASGLDRMVRPHGLRHRAITAALDLTNDVRKVRQFARHANVNTTLRYDAARRAFSGEITRALGAED
jgi:integrase/recombinase XerC